MGCKRPGFSPKDRLDTFKAFGAIVLCQAGTCDSAIYIAEAEIDHHVALIDGGEHTLSNWRPICSSCHRKKSAREHKANSKSKRLSKARTEHEAVVDRVMVRPAGKIRSPGFRQHPTLKRQVGGKVVTR